MANTKKTNPIAVAMRKRHPRSQSMSSRKRTKDYKNSWKKEIMSDMPEVEDSKDQNVDYDPAWIIQDPDYLWSLPEEQASTCNNTK